MTLSERSPESFIGKDSKTFNDTIAPEAVPSITAEDNRLILATKHMVDKQTVSQLGFPDFKMEDVLDPITDDHGKIEKPKNPDTIVSDPMKKRISELIEKLGDEEYEVREAAQREILRIGSPAYAQLEEAKRSSPELEVRRRASSAINQILNEKPAALRAMTEMTLDGLAEIAMTGRVSKETRERYARFIENADDFKMGAAESRARHEFANKRLGPSDSLDLERATKREQLSLVAMRTSPSSQARMDYADLLIAGGDKKAAIKVLTEAVTKDPALAEHGGSKFGRLARDSGALDDKVFTKAVDTARGRENATKDWSGPKIKVSQNLEYLQEQTTRFGLTKQIERQWNTHLDDLEKRAQQEPAQQKFLEGQLELARMNLVEHLGASGKSERAVQLLSALSKASPQIEQTAWFKEQARVNEMPGSKKLNQPMQRRAADGTVLK